MRKYIFLEVSNFNITNLFFTYAHSLWSAFFVAKGNYKVGADLHPSKEVVGHNVLCNKNKGLGSESKELSSLVAGGGFC